MLNTQRVHLVHDPTRIGVLTGRTRRRGTRLLAQVQFPDTIRWIPEHQLQAIPDQLSPLDMLKDKKLGRPVDLRRTLTHVKLSGRMEDMIYSMEITNTEFYAFQFKPVLKILDSPSNRILIADEVGLGKTIEAGLIWTELRSRYDMRRLMVLCPAALREKWRYELSSKFGVDAQICNARETLQKLTDRTSHSRGFAIVASIQGLRPPQHWENHLRARTSAADLARFLQAEANEDRLIDLLVIDEAHHLRNSSTQNHLLGRLTRDVSEYAVFLTATPIHNRNSDLHSLLRLLDPNSFSDHSAFDRILTANRPLVKARDLVLSRHLNPPDLRKLLKTAERHPLLRSNRQLRMILASDMVDKAVTHRDIRSQLAYRLETVNLLAHVVTRTRKRDVKEKKVIRNPTLELVDLHTAERQFYQIVTDSVIEYAQDRRANERFLLAQPQRQMTSSMAASLRRWQQKYVDLDNSTSSGRADDEVAHEDFGPLLRHIVLESSRSVQLAELVENDTKYFRLKNTLQHFFQKHPKDKVVVFSTFRATLRYLAERLVSDGIQCVVLMGGQKQPKDETINRFRETGGPNVLLSSEVGGEGVDLQFAWVLINYDLPWNPMRIEQRIGRIDRLGQKSPKVEIINILYDDTIDSRIYQRLYDKLDLCRSALGDFDAILGEEIRKLERDLISKRLTREQQNERIEQTSLALEMTRRIEEQLENDAASLVAYGDYILNHIHEVRRLHRWIVGEDLLRYVSDYLRLRYTGSTLRQTEGGPCVVDIRLSNRARLDLEDYVRKTQIPYTGRLTSPSGKPVRCRFENSVVQPANRRSEEAISQFHPLVRMAKSQNDREHDITPAVSLRVDHKRVAGLIERGLYLLAVSRWSFRGLQNTERLAYAAVPLAGARGRVSTEIAERMIAAAVQYGSDWIEGRNTVDLDKAYRMALDLVDELYDQFEEQEAQISARNKDRADIQQRNLDAHRTRRMAVLKATRQTHALKGRQPLVKATEGRMQALESRFEQERLRIGKRREVVAQNDEVALVVVDIA